METKIRAYVDTLFENTTPSRKAVELKEEIIQNLTEKYSDLLAEGKTPAAACNIAIAGLGDISGLLDELEKDAPRSVIPEELRRRSAMRTAIAVMLIIISVLPLITLAILFGTKAAVIIGLCLMFVLVALGAGLLIYNAMVKPKLPKDTVVEEFKDWQSGNKELKAMRDAINTAIWTIAVALYFIISFTTGWWHLSWIVFLLAADVNAIVNAFFVANK
jgi:hypothetical protein